MLTTTAATTTTTKLRIFLFISIAVERLQSASGQQVPQSPCAQFFEYRHDGFGYYGLISFPQWPVGKAEVRAHISQRGLSSSNYYGRITPYPDEPTVVRNVLQHKGAMFRVDFADSGNPPKLTLLSKEGQQLCSDTDYPPPSSWGQLSYTLSTYYIDPNGNMVTSVNEPFDPNRVTFQRDPYRSDSHIADTTTLSSSYTPTHVFTPIAPVPSSNTGRPTPAPATPSVTPSPAGPVSSVNVNGICGQEGAVLTAFVYGGTDIEPGQFPWLTAIYRKKGFSNLNFKCGGTLISHSTVITAAHCFENVDASQIVLFLGRYNLLVVGEENLISADAKTLIIHPNYKHNTAEADLALILIEPVQQFTRYIKPICLWSESDDQSAIIGKRATVVGWGNFDSDDGSDEISPIPKKVQVNVASNEDCSRTTVFESLVNSNTICAGNRDGSGPCTGDSGGGLMMERNGRWTLRGIVSLGQALRNKCNLLEYVVYCDVAKYSQWIRDNMTS